MTKSFTSAIFICVSLAFVSCSPSENIAGKYRTNFPDLGFFGTTVILKRDKTFDYTFSGDMIFHHVTGKYKIYDKKIYMLFDEEILDTNFVRTPLFDDTVKTSVNKYDTISYQYFLYMGHNKLFFSHRQTEKKVTRAKRYNKRKQHLFYGSHYYKRRWYLKKTD